ncbi:unnamed protein product [Lymnaea stagnalis]|uniref:G-protein coupled receptors family 1 profile domain-containing protein n=1 Tax=Lymnaea stagnalis TaxID=6523 RepID=A0AAV2H4K0_LYMST
MEQSMEYSSFKTLLYYTNISTRQNVTAYNFSGADAILTAFRHDFQQIGYSNIVLLAMYLPIFIVALVGNLLVLVTLVVQMSWRANHVYMLNLSICDLLVTFICMPCTATTIIYRLWLSGLVLCKMAFFLQGVAVATGIFTLTAMSVDRYMSIQHPSHAHWSSAPSHALVLTAVTWTTSAVFMAPQLYVRTVDTLTMPDLPSMTFCIEHWPQDQDKHIFGLLLLLVMFVIPVLILAVCYANVGKMLCSYTLSREDSNTSNVTYIFCRKRAARILVLLVGLFICCWLPYNIMSIMIDLGDMSGLVPFLPFALWLGHAHSAVNPVLYWVTNRRFREMVAKLRMRIQRPCIKKKRRPRRV